MDSGMPQRPETLNVLVAEDDPNDILLLNLARTNHQVPAKFLVVRDGDQALEYLQGKHQYADRAAFPFPDMLLLDLKMPGLNGIEVVRWLRKQPRCAHLPAVIMSGSGLEKDVKEAYLAGANTYFRKPSSVADLAALLQAFALYWQMSERPGKGNFYR